MKRFSWDPEKNKKLKEERDVSFEEIVFYIGRGHLLDIIENQNNEKYRGQRVLIVEIDAYAYLVPNVEDEKEIFLKTIIPSRKATKQYLRERHDNA